MHPPLLTQLEGRFPLARHEHVAVLYRDHAAAHRFTSFLAEGLERGEWCLYLAPASFQAEMVARLGALGADVNRHLQLGTLRLQEGMANLRALREWTQGVFVKAEEARVPAIRWFEEGCWPKFAGFPTQQFCEFHAVLNYQVKHYPSVALCQYAVDRIEPRLLFCSISVHRHVLVGDILVRDNPFYIPAERYLLLKPGERESTVRDLFREVGFDVERLLAALAGFGRLGATELRER